VRLVGVCFGHQIIGRALGQKVGRSDGGWEISVTPMQLTAKGKELFGLDEVVSSGLDMIILFLWYLPHTLIREQAIHQMHQDAVFTYPPSVEHLGHSPSCHVQGMYERKRLITTQGHPEFDGDIVEELLENRHDRGVFDDKTYEDAMGRVRRHHDGVKVAAAFLRFMVEE
jgi:GMP synthase-like glutamine amidotransferase